MAGSPTLREKIAESVLPSSAVTAPNSTGNQIHHTNLIAHLREMQQDLIVLQHDLQREGNSLIETKRIALGLGAHYETAIVARGQPMNTGEVPAGFL